MQQAINLYGKDYYKGIPKERLTGRRNPIVFKKYEIKRNLDQCNPKHNL